MVLFIVKQEYRDVNAAPSQRADGGSCCNWMNIQIIQGRTGEDSPGHAAHSLPNVFMAKASMTFRGLMQAGICMFVSGDEHTDFSNIQGSSSLSLSHRRFDFEEQT